MGSKNYNINTEEMIFSLDIGTRTIIGLVGIYENGTFKVLESEIVEHDKRNMYDGQIHDINGVVQIVEKVKKRLEERLGIQLDKVAIAAAGRALKTLRIKVDREIDVTREIDKGLIESLEMEAIQSAQEQLDSTVSGKDSKYYCVGYTVVNYFLDDNFIENLEGHRGNKISADVLATFLPHVVVDSLYTVMSRVGLEVINMTLEPIAAINVAIKKNLRLLNLALVDIGAGTSDIAITKDGTIVAYAMAPVAGDEITESIAKTYLLDYDSAEKIKVNLNKESKHKFFDVVGIEHELTTDEILNSIEENIRSLAKEIAQQILEYNESSPSAVFLIGGGSQVPRLATYIAEYLQLPEERVVVRSTDIINDAENIPDVLKGPHAITPIGIAKTAIDSKFKDFLEIVVNGQKIKMFNSKELKVSDALVLVGFNPKKLIPRRGEKFVYYLNGDKMEIKGEIGEPAQIYVNRKKSNLEQKLKNGDMIEVKEATEGKKVQPYLYDCIDIEKKVFLNGKKIKMVKSIKVNGTVVNENIPLKDNDSIEVDEIRSIRELINSQDINIDECTVYRNEEKADYDDLINDNDKIETEPLKKEEINDEKIIRLKVNGEELNIRYEKDKFIFIDIFNYIDFDLSKPHGLIVLKVNGLKADYAQELKDGDELEIYWEKSQKHK